MTGHEAALLPSLRPQNATRPSSAPIPSPSNQPSSSTRRPESAASALEPSNDSSPLPDHGSRDDRPIAAKSNIFDKWSRVESRRHKSRSSGAFLLPNIIPPTPPSPISDRRWRQKQQLATPNRPTTPPSQPPSVQSSQTPKPSPSRLSSTSASTLALKATDEQKELEPVTPEDEHLRMTRIRPHQPIDPANEIPARKIDHGSLGRWQRRAEGEAATSFLRPPDQPSLTSPVTDSRVQQLSPASHDTAAPLSPIDLDSTQIVNMALNLSESRRAAQNQRRSVSHNLPPTLSPVTRSESPMGGNLKRHLQQQRRISSTQTQRPLPRGLSFRSSSARSPRFSSPPGAFDLSSSPLPARLDTHFSRSTLARTIKAKEFLELHALYRRLLELVPPMKPPANNSDGRRLGSTSTTLSSPSVFHHLDLGRPYNPLQYVRNRKVRARERKGIDGEAQGFNDIAKVSAWADEVAKWVATGQPWSPTGTTLPPYTPAEEAMAQSQSAPELANLRGPGHGSGGSWKPNRPRIDWIVSPADMLADLYWLKQDDNKKFIEDRDWNRVFPQDHDTHITLSSPTRVGEPKPAGSATRRGATGLVVREIPQVTTVSDLEAIDTAREGGLRVQKSRDKARRKLQNLKGHHPHHHGADHVHLPHGRHHVNHRRRHSVGSDSDDSDDQRRKARRTMRTASQSGKDILEKHMMSLIAQEAKEGQDLDQLKRLEEQIAPVSSMTHPMSPETLEQLPLPTGSLAHSRAGSSHSDQSLVPRPDPRHAHAPNIDEAAANTDSRTNDDAVISPVRPLLDSSQRRHSAAFDGFANQRHSISGDPLRPSSIEFPQRGGRHSQPVLRLNSQTDDDASSPSASSSSSSPTHIHLSSRVKNMFRNRSRGRTRTAHDDPRRTLKSDATRKYYAPPEVTSVLAPPLGNDGGNKDTPRLSTDHPSSRSSVRKSMSSSLRPPATDWQPRLRSSTTSLPGRGAEGSSGSGIRTFFKVRPPRIDNIFRAGVSKVGDILWRKDAELAAPSQSSTFSTDADEPPSSCDKARAEHHNKTLLPQSSPQATNLAAAAGDQPPNTTLSATARNIASTGGAAPVTSKAPLPVSTGPTRPETLRPGQIDAEYASSSSSSSPPRKRPPPDGMDTARISSTPLPPSPRRGSIPAAEGGAPTMGGSVVSSSSPKTVRGSKLPGTTAATAQVLGLTRADYNMPSLSAAEIPFSRRDIARVRALMVRSGIIAREIHRRAYDFQPLSFTTTSPHHPGDSDNYPLPPPSSPSPSVPPLPPPPPPPPPPASSSLTSIINAYHPPSPSSPSPHLHLSDHQAPPSLYPTLAHSIAHSIRSTESSFLLQPNSHSTTTSHPQTRLLDTLTDRARRAADTADECTRDLVARHRLVVSRAAADMDKLLRRRRRRFRWFRRAGWAVVEWAVVGALWAVWFVVVVVRILVGVARGVGGIMRWLVWL